MLFERIAELENRLAQQQAVLLESQQTAFRENQARLQELEARLIKQAAVLEDQQLTIAHQKAMIERLRQLLYGQKRERFEPPNGQLSLFEEASPQTQEALEEQAAQQVTVTYTRQKKAHPGRMELPAHLEVVETVLEPTEDLTDMVCIGQEVTEELDYRPEKFFIHRIIRKKYAPLAKEGAFAIAPMPERVIQKGIPSASLLTQLLIDKYVDHQPLYRIRARFARQGIKIPESTLDGWVKKSMERLLILYEYATGLLKSQAYLQVDETTLKVQDPKLKGKTHLGYYWVYHAPMTGWVLFEYHPSRSGKHVWETLKGYRGYLQTDGYAGYNHVAALEGIIHLVCLAHIRRKFHEALDSDAARAGKALAYIQQLYQIERQATEQQLDAGQRKALRLEVSLACINEMGKWIAQEMPRVLPKSPIGKAMRYAMERWQEMANYLLDGNLLPDNNLIENHIRPVALGRKNYLFAGSHEAAKRSAIIYTFMAQCKTAKVNPNVWLEHVLQNILETPINKIASLLPHHFQK